MNKIYYKSPILFQHLFTSLYGYKLKKERYNKEFQVALNSYSENKHDLELLINNLLLHLKNKIPFYEHININEDDVLESLKNLPLTNKDDLRRELEKRSYITRDVRVVKTGGTTGKSLKVYHSKLDRAYRMAYLDYIKLLNNVRPFSKRASFTGKEITPENHRNILWRYNYPMNQILYASFKLNKDNVAYVYNNMRKNEVETIDGFPSSIHLLAKYILTNNIKVDWDIKAVFPTAETLTENVKEDIEKAFRTIVIDQYASSEGAPFIYSNRENAYAIANETGFFEFYKVGENVYDMVVTSFINYATPIVRYNIGDRVLINSQKEYLNSFEDNVKIKKILGRNSDYLVGNNNNIVTSANMSNVVKDLGNKVIQSQFIQIDKHHFHINLVASKEYSKKNDEKIIINKLEHRLGTNNHYNFNYLEELPKEKSGKTRFIINQMH